MRGARTCLPYSLPLPSPLPSTSVGPSIQTNFAPVSGTDRGFGSVTIYSCSAIVRGGGWEGEREGEFVYIDRHAEVSSGTERLRASFTPVHIVFH